MSRRVLAWLYCVAATVVLVVLIAQLVFLVAVLLSVVQLETPLVSSSEEQDAGRSTVSYHGNLYTVVPLSTGLAVLASYSIHRKRLDNRGRAKLYLYGVVAVVVGLAVVFTTVYLAVCGYTCVELRCGVGNVQECSTSVAWFYATASCLCK